MAHFLTKGCDFWNKGKKIGEIHRDFYLCYQNPHLQTKNEAIIESYDRLYMRNEFAERRVTFNMSGNQVYISYDGMSVEKHCEAT